MPDERNCGCGCNNGILGGCGDDCSILFSNCGCGCNRENGK